MIKELIIDLRQVENVLIYKVIQQDESFTGGAMIYRNGDVSIYSRNYKAIDICGRNILLYINGVNEEKNCLVWSEFYDSIERATEIKDKIEKCVAEFNTHIRKENEKEKYGFSYEETYWFIDEYGTISNSRWSNDKFDKFRYNSKNAFKTKEEAKRKLEILNYIYENQTIFTKEQWEDVELYKFDIYAGVEESTLIVSYNCFYKDAKYFFKNEKIAQKVADFIGYDDFMKYL